MDKKSYEVLTGNWPRKDPAGAGAVVELTEIEAKYSILSGDLKLMAAEPAKEKQPRKAKPDTQPDGAGEPGTGDGEKA